MNARTYNLRGKSSLPHGWTGKRWHVMTAMANDCREFDEREAAQKYYDSLGWVATILYDTETWPAVVVLMKNIRP